MSNAFVEFIVSLAETDADTTVADVLERIVLERHYIAVEGQDAFSLEELSGI